MIPGPGFFNRFPRFLVTGSIATAVHWSLMALLVTKGVNPVLATALGAIAGLVVAYTGHYYLTFQARDSHFRALPGFLLIAGFGWLVNLLVFFLFSVYALPVPWAQLLATMCATLCNYILSHLFVFSTHASARDQQS